MVNIPFDKEYTESICIGADGFCFQAGDGTVRTVIVGPWTTIPDCSLSQTDMEILFRKVFPDRKDLSVVLDRIPELDIALLCGAESTTLQEIRSRYPDAAIHSHMYHILNDTRYRGRNRIALFRIDGGFETAAICDGKAAFMNTIHSTDTYRSAYTIARVWKELGFNQSSACITTYGIESDSNIIRTLKQLTGEETVCVS